ncbi:transcriptional regulator [Nocardiopsis alba]|uniref:transcriptional regulator n=1 Tax=Nocardiopsis alba TaxID=53437 RepID=UPI0033B6DF1A
MVTYLYRCPDRHETDLDAPMGRAPRETDCPCGRSARRAFTAPMVRAVPAARGRVMEAAEQSTDRPAVVTRPAPGPAPTSSTDPRHALLPWA